MDIALIGNTLLRSAIRQNLVSFPSQVPALMQKQYGGILERVVQLYFLRGWSVRNICARYRLSKSMVQKLLGEWRMRAVAAGYIQNIHPEDLEALARAQRDHADDENQQDDLAYAAHEAAFIFDSRTPIWAPTPAQGERTISAAGGL